MLINRNKLKSLPGLNGRLDKSVSTTVRKFEIDSGIAYTTTV